MVDVSFVWNGAATNTFKLISKKKQIISGAEVCAINYDRRQRNHCRWYIIH